MARRRQSCRPPPVRSARACSPGWRRTGRAIGQEPAGPRRATRRREEAGGCFRRSVRRGCSFAYPSTGGPTGDGGAAVKVVLTLTATAMSQVDVLASIAPRPSGVHASVVVAVVIFSIRPDHVGQPRLQVLLVR